jgi:hypothetical protein
MDKVYESGASAAPPVPPAIPSVGYPSRGNPATGTMPTVPGPYMMHQLVEEIMAVIAAGNIVPDKLVLSQLKLALDAVYVKKNGTSPILQNFPGLTRSLTALGGGLVREYADVANAATVGGLEIGMVYNCAIDPVTGVWAGRDIADICWLEKWHDMAGTKEIWFAVTGTAGSVPVWVQAYSLTAATGALTVGGAVSAALAILPTHLLRQDQATAQFTPVSYSTKSLVINANTILTIAQCQGQTYVIQAAATITLPIPNANGEITFVNNAGGIVIAAPAGVLMVYPDGVQIVAGTIALGFRDVVTLTSISGAWFITFMTGQPIVKPATLPNQAVAMSQAYGIAQTWQNVAATRVLGTVYTNTTGKAIKLIVVCSMVTAGSGSISAAISGGAVFSIANGNNTAGSYIMTGTVDVPPGATYAITSTALLVGWMELR